MKTFGFPKSARLLKPHDFSGVFQNVTIRVPHRHFLLLATPNELGHARVGLVFSRKSLKLAVQRNRVKRQVRETFRHQQDLPAVDVVVLSRQGLATVSNTELAPMLNDLWRRLRRKAVAPSQPAKASRGSG